MIVVFGSINLDLVTRVERLPAPGETLLGRSFASYPGGKGANQALAAARAGAEVRLFGAVGRDAAAQDALSLLRAGNVDLAGVRTVDVATGRATILVDDAGENAIVAIPGASALADAAMVPDQAMLPEATLVLQQEVAASANAALIARAARAGMRIVVNAAPARPLPREQLAMIDTLIVNETEAASLAAAYGWPAAAEDFATTGARVIEGLTIVVTLGAAGAVAVRSKETIRVDAPPVAVVDTTGAGDAFVGALAAALDAGSNRVTALPIAVAAGSLACTRAGAQTALPTRSMIDALLPMVTTRQSRGC